MAVRDLGIVTAYGYAVEGGYTGTEQEFTALLGDLALTVEDLENMTVSVTTLEPNQQATASYADGVLSLGIPKGVAGEVQFSDLEPLAEKDGNYENFTAGSALQLISDKYTENKEPYLFRKSIAGDRELDTVVGGSVAFNQIIPIEGPAVTRNGLTFTPDGNGAVFVNGTATATTDYVISSPISARNTHKYLMTGCPSGGSNTTYYMSDGYYKRDSGNGYIGDLVLARCVITIANGATINNLKFVPQIFDLTQMFGSSVADYIYALEQATTGAGVAFFRAMFPKDYYPYNAGELMSVKTTAHEMVGFNQWDEEWELGGLSAETGLPYSSTTSIRSKNYIPVFPNTTYYYKSSANVMRTFYTADLTFLGIEYGYNTTFTTPANAHYMKLGFVSAYGTTYKSDTCISFSSDRNGEYQPYTKHTYALDDVELRGVMKLDGTPYFDGDTYEADGTVTRRFGVVDLGTLTWTYDATYRRFSAVLADSKNGTRDVGCVCSKYPTIFDGRAFDSSWDKVGYIASHSVYIEDSAYNTAAAFKTAMSGVYLVYELATPTTETADPYTSPQIVDVYGTERYVDERTVAVPVGHVTKYPDNLREKLDGLPWDFSSLIAPTEKAYTATRNYTTGSLFIVGNILYKATANIANGGTITPNTNCTATTLAEVISAL